MSMRITVLALLVAVTPQTRATINRAFRPNDFEILLTANPSEALETSARLNPDLLLMDLNQPLHLAWGIFERLMTANPGAPVVVLAEHESIYDVTIASRNGAVLHKPVGLATLAQTVNGLLKLPSGAAPQASAKAGPGDMLTESETLRPMLIQRATTPHPPVSPYHRWGINE